MYDIKLFDFPDDSRNIYEKFHEFSWILKKIKHVQNSKDSRHWSMQYFIKFIFVRIHTYLRRETKQVLKLKIKEHPKCVIYIFEHTNKSHNCLFAYSTLKHRGYENLIKQIFVWNRMLSIVKKTTFCITLNPL